MATRAPQSCRPGLQASWRGAWQADSLTPQNHFLYPKPCLSKAGSVLGKQALATWFWDSPARGGQRSPQSERKCPPGVTAPLRAHFLCLHELALSYKNGHKGQRGKGSCGPTSILSSRPRGGLHPRQLSLELFFTLALFGDVGSQNKGSDFVFMRWSYLELLWARPQTGGLRSLRGTEPRSCPHRGPGQCLHQGLGCKTDICFWVCRSGQSDPLPRGLVGW